MFSVTMEEKLEHHFAIFTVSIKNKDPFST